MREDIDKTFGAGSAVRLAQQAADSMDVRKQALRHLDEILNPSRHLARQAETSLDIVRRFAADSSLAAAKSVAAHDMQMVERLAQDVGYRDVARALEDASTPAYQQFARDYEAASLGFDDWLAQVDTREWVRRGLESMLAIDLAADNRLFDANKAIERAIKSASAQFPDLASPIEVALRSIDVDPTLRAAREVAALLEQIRQEEGDAESLDEVQSRFARLNLAALRKALFSQLHQVLAVARKHGLGVLVALDVAYESLTPLTQAVTLELGKQVFVLGAFALSNPAPPVSPEPAGMTSTAKPADPLHRTSEILYSDSDVAMRTAPDHELPTFANVPARGFMRVVGRLPGWYLVSYVASDGHRAQADGWVEADTLKSADAETVRLLWCALSDVPPPKDCSQT